MLNNLLYALLLIGLIFTLSDCTSFRSHVTAANEYVLDSFDITLPEYEIINDDFRRILDSSLVDILDIYKIEKDIKNRFPFPYFITVDFEWHLDSCEVIVKLSKSYSGYYGQFGYFSSPGDYDTFPANYDEFPVNYDTFPANDALFTSPRYIHDGVIMYKDIIVVFSGNRDYNGSIIEGKTIMKSRKCYATFKGYGYRNPITDIWSCTIATRMFYNYTFYRNKNTFYLNKKILDDFKHILRKK